MQKNRKYNATNYLIEFLNKQDFANKKTKDNKKINNIKKELNAILDSIDLDTLHEILKEYNIVSNMNETKKVIETLLVAEIKNST